MAGKQLDSVLNSQMPLIYICLIFVSNKHHFIFFSPIKKSVIHLYFLQGFALLLGMCLVLIITNVDRLQKLVMVMRSCLDMFLRAESN